MNLGRNGHGSGSRHASAAVQGHSHVGGYNRFQKDLAGRLFWPFDAFKQRVDRRFGDLTDGLAYGGEFALRVIIQPVESGDLDRARQLGRGLVVMADDDIWLGL